MTEIFLSDWYQITMIIILVVVVIAWAAGTIASFATSEPELVPVVFFVACCAALMAVVWPLILPLLFVGSGAWTYRIVKKDIEKKRARR